MLVAMLIIFFMRKPSYTIQTTGKLYLVNKVSRDIQAFDLFTGKELAKIPIAMESHEAIAINDKIVLTNYGAIDSDGNIIKVIDTKTNEVEKIIDLKGNISANGIVAFPECNKAVLIDYVSNNLVLLNIETDSTEKQIPTQQKSSHLLVLHPSKPLAYVTNTKSNSVSVIDLTSNDVVKIIPCGMGTESIDISPDGSEIWVTNKIGNSITIINTSTYEVIDTLATGNEPLKVKFSVDGKYALVTNAKDGTIYVYDKQSKKRIKTIILRGKTTLFQRILYHTPYPVNILMHPNGLYAFVSNSNASKIEVIDMRTFTVVSTIGTGKIPDALVFVD
jgi:YVTN family beta-propeller protein